MIKFNLRRVLQANKSPKELLKTLYDLAYTKNASNKTLSFSKGPLSSYMTGLGKLIGAPASAEDKYEYFVLAGTRNLADYNLLGITYLDLELWPDIDVVKLQKNRLLKIEGSKVYFTLETD